MEPPPSSSSSQPTTSHPTDPIPSPSQPPQLQPQPLPPPSQPTPQPPPSQPLPQPPPSQPPPQPSQSQPSPTPSLLPPQPPQQQPHSQPLQQLQSQPQPQQQAQPQSQPHQPPQPQQQPQLQPHQQLQSQSQSQPQQQPQSQPLQQLQSQPHQQPQSQPQQQTQPHQPPQPQSQPHQQLQPQQQTQSQPNQQPQPQQQPQSLPQPLSHQPQSQSQQQSQPQQQQHQHQPQQQQQQHQQQPQQQQQHQQEPQQQQQPPLNPNLNPTNSHPSYPQQQPISFSRPSWSQPTSQFSHFSSQFQSSASPSAAPPPPQRGGIAIGVPAHHPSASSGPSQPAASFSSAFGVQYGAALPRNPVSVSGPSVVPSSSTSLARPVMHGMPSMGMIGSQIRHGGVPPSALHQQRPMQAASGTRAQTTSNNMPSVTQNFQGHGILRASSITPPNASTPSTSQSQLSPHQPWLSAQQGRPPLPSQTIRPQVNPQSLQQRSHISQQSPQPVQANSQPQQLMPSQQQHQQQQQQQQQQQLLSTQQQHQSLPSPQQQQHIPASNQAQENYGQQLPPSRVLQPLPNQQQIVRVQGSANQKSPSPTMGQVGIAHSGPIENVNAAEISEPCSTILGKRSIQELVNQIDPSEKLDADVEDVLVDIAEEFIDSVTTFGCSLAKHRKSNTLEAKDILLHLERTWNMTLPGFTGDEIKTYKKTVINDVHKERLALIKKSFTGADNKTSAGPATGNVKGHLAKATPNVVGS